MFYLFLFLQLYFSSLIQNARFIFLGEYRRYKKELKEEIEKIIEVVAQTLFITLIVPLRLIVILIRLIIKEIANLFKND